MAENSEVNNSAARGIDNIVEQLAKLTSLKESGAITPEEFQKLKTNLLETDRSDSKEVRTSETACVPAITNTNPATQGTLPVRKTSGMAITSFVLSLLSIILAPLLILALILGFMALSRIKRSGQLLSGRGFAIAGVTISIVVLIVTGILIMITIPVLTSKVEQKILEAQVTTTKSNLAILRNAVYQFKMDTGRFPTEHEGLNALVRQPADVSDWEPGGYL